MVQAHLENLSVTRWFDSRLGANAGDLEWLIPTRMAHQNPYRKLTALFSTLDRHRIPYLFAVGTPHALPNRYREAVCPGPERAHWACGAVDFKRTTVLGF